MKANKEFSTCLIDMKDSLIRYAYSLTYNIDDAEDLVQESFYKAFHNYESFNSETNLKAWMYTILKNTFFNNYRRKNKTNAIFSADIKNLILNNRPANSNPISDYSYHELNKMIDSLDPEFRIPFQMYNAGYKYQEIADKLNLKLGTVKSRIHFSRQKLIQRIGSNIDLFLIFIICYIK